MTPQPCTATILAAPRIGPQRELKRATERDRAGTLSRAELASIAAGLDSVPANTFSYYDHRIDTAVLWGALPGRVAGIADDLDRYFAAARGNDEIQPLETTKWFDTNDHYIVPEIGPRMRFALNPATVPSEGAEAQALGITDGPVVVGPQ